MTTIREEMKLTITVATLYQQKSVRGLAHHISELSAGEVTFEAVFDVVRRHLTDILDDLRPEQITLDDRMTDLGANSMDRMDVVSASAHELGVRGGAGWE